MQSQIKEYAQVHKLVLVIPRDKASELLTASYLSLNFGSKYSSGIFSAGGLGFH